MTKAEEMDKPVQPVSPKEFHDAILAINENYKHPILKINAIMDAVHCQASAIKRQYPAVRRDQISQEQKEQT